MRRFYLPTSGRQGRRLIFLPPTARHIVRVLCLKRGERWSRIAAEAARQSGQSLVPPVHSPLKWSEFLPLVSAYDLRLLAWEEEEKRSLKSVLAEFKPGESPARVLIAIGPEGGFTHPEVDRARAAGFQSVTLGLTTLRAATAGVAALSAIHHHFGT